MDPFGPQGPPTGYQKGATKAPEPAKTNQKTASNLAFLQKSFWKKTEVSSHESLGKNCGSLVTGATGMGRHTPLTKQKEADAPCHTRLSTHAPSATQVRNGLVGSRASVKEFKRIIVGRKEF